MTPRHGYLAYGNHHADLLFEVVSRRYEDKPIVLTTNTTFSQWNKVFPSATSSKGATLPIRGLT